MTLPNRGQSPQPPRGLRRIWRWIRTTIFFAAPPAPAKPQRPQTPRTPPEPQPVASQPVSQDFTEPPPEEEEAPLEPAGTVMRVSAAPSEPAVVVAPIREGLSEVPPLPHVVRELLRELSDPASNARSVAAIAASDPALAASLIRTVNSAAMGLRRKITSVAEAVSLLGYSLVRSLVIRMRLQLIMPTRGGGQQAYDAEDLWVHSLAVAYAAEALAERLPELDKGFVSTLGLLHDIGKLAINSYFPTSAEEVRTRSPERPDESFLDRERRILGADHAEIGAMLASHWKLPPDLVEAIRWHHAPQAAPATLPESVRKAAILVHAANQLAKYCYVYSEDMEIDIVGDELLREAGLPGPLTRLLGSRVRKAISRAIFFADDSSTTQTLGAIRRFLRVSEKPALPSLPPGEPGRHEPYVAWADDAWVERMFGEPMTIDCSPSSAARLDRLLPQCGRRVRLTSRCTAGGIDRLLDAATTHLDQLLVDEQVKLPAKFVLRRLLPNLSEIAASEPVEVFQAYAERFLITAVRCPALAFEERFGPQVPHRIAKHVLNGEMANVLNLRWFARVMTPRDGSAILFINPVG
jgi:putative nucleotidyltransferase with HDIG domain